MSDEHFTVDGKLSTRIGFIAVELVVWRKIHLELTQSLENCLAAVVAVDAKLSLAAELNLYVVSLLQFKRVDDGDGQTDGEAVPHFATFILSSRIDTE